MTTSTDLETKTPEIANPDDGGDVAHIVRKEDQMTGYFEGQEITALCGHKWVPTKDPEPLPRCGLCMAALGMIRSM